MTLSVDEDVIGGHVQTRSDFGDVTFLGLKRNEEVNYLKS